MGSSILSTPTFFLYLQEKPMFIKGAAFDASYVNGLSGDHSRELKFHNIVETKHHENLEEDYKMLRDNGFTFFRDSAWLTSSDTWEINWNWLDRLAKLSNGDIQLSILHYEIPMWHSAPLPEVGRILAKSIASRYKGVFHSYIPGVELGYQAAMMGKWKRWYPIKEDWWEAWNIVAPTAIYTALGLKDGDPSCKIALAEPWNFNDSLPFEDQARPFNTLLFKEEPHQDKIGFLTRRGDKDLLDIIGLNMYATHNMAHSIKEARRLFPDKEIHITETGNCHNPHISIQDWDNLIEQAIKESGVEVSQVCWSPAIQMFDFENQHPGKGHLFSLEREKVW